MPRQRLAGRERGRFRSIFYFFLNSTFQRDSLSRAFPPIASRSLGRARRRVAAHTESPTHWLKGAPTKSYPGKIISIAASLQVTGTRGIPAMWKDCGRQASQMRLQYKTELKKKQKKTFKREIKHSKKNGSTQHGGVDWSAHGRDTRRIIFNQCLEVSIGAAVLVRAKNCHGQCRKNIVGSRQMIVTLKCFSQSCCFG